MAIMWPRKIPREVRNNPLRKAECKVYDALQSALDNKWTVFYSRPWLGLSPTGEERDGEADFVLAHPQYGVMCLEVKGGEIKYDPVIDKWTSTDRHSVVHKIKNPFEQAKRAKYKIRDYLEVSHHWKSRKIRHYRGVIFPDTLVPNRDYGPDRPRELVCDRKQFDNSFAEWILERVSCVPEDGNCTGVLGDDGTHALEKLLAEPIHFKRPLSYTLNDDEREIEVLTQKQYYLLESFRRIPRLSVCGGAGTGKTVLAMEAAKRIADDGKSVLLTCYNSALARYLGGFLDKKIDVRSFHSLCQFVAGQVGMPIPNNVPEKELFENALPQVLFDSASKWPHKYDAIIVDEAQDFRAHWWPALESTLVKNGRLLVFHDSNQRVYNAPEKLPKEIDSIPILLNQNLRNTDPIHFTTMKYYDGEVVHPNGVEGQAVEFISAATGKYAKEALHKKINHLVGIEKVPPEHIAVLALNEIEMNLLLIDSRLAGIAVCRCDVRESSKVVLDTIRRFKGLDAPLVIIVASSQTIAEQELMYVASSRARAHLIFINNSSPDF